MCSGPANDDEATGDSVTDMGVLLANRTTWLAARGDESYVWRLLDEVAFTDTDSDYNVIDSVNVATWASFAQFTFAAVVPPSDPIDIRIEFHGTVDVTLADWAELRLRAVKGAVDVHSSHFRVENLGNDKYTSVSLALNGHALSASDLQISLDGKLATATGALNIRGSAKMLIYGLTKIEVPT
jgi:hypothetical protein